MCAMCVRVGRKAALMFDDSLGVIDFCPSSNIAVVYITEAELVAGTTYRRRLVRLSKVSAPDCDGIHLPYDNNSAVGCVAVA